MIRIDSLEKRYRSKKSGEVKTLKGIFLDLPDRGLVFVSGNSGSGKSTFLHLLGGLDHPTGGEIIVDGRSTGHFRERDFDCYRNEYVGFVFQEYNLIEQYSVGSNVLLAAELQHRKTEREAWKDFSVGWG